MGGDGPKPATPFDENLNAASFAETEENREKICGWI